MIPVPEEDSSIAQAYLRPIQQELTTLHIRLTNKTLNQLGDLSQPQIEQLIKQAEHLRARAGAKSDALDPWVLRALKKDKRAMERATERVEGIIASVMAREALVELPDGTLARCLIGNHAPVVGDIVSIGLVGDELQLIHMAPRRTQLSRADVKSGGQQLLAANVDTVVIVVSVVSPPLHPRIIDRYLVAIRQGGAQAALCLNKLDLLDDIDDLEKLEPYEQAGLLVVKCSAQRGEGVSELRRVLAGQMVVFVGHSGVGKSSIINAFAPELNLKTGSVSEGYGRGTHTTTTSSLHRLADGTVLIDTPGIRSFGLFEADEDDIAAAFPEFSEFACRFKDCRHISEPECGVWSAVESGKIAEERYWAYRRLLGKE